VDADNTLLLIHGWGSNATTWAAHVKPLARRFRVIAVDLRGHGSSGTGPAGSGTVSRLAQDLAELLARVHAQRVIAIGHSMGGTVATILAVERPDLIVGLVVVDPAYGAEPDEMLTVDRRLAECTESGGLEPARTIANAFSPGADPRLVIAARHNVLGTPRDALATGFASMYLGPQAFGSVDSARIYLARRRRPVLAIYPSESRAKTDRSTDTDDLTVVIARVASHFLHEEDPEWFVDLVSEWTLSLT
ncbi:MAG: putative hydrolase, partial [Frondihabitans sp.]|nr:putative hydrolase [Frondihabitans sp.]